MNAFDQVFETGMASLARIIDEHEWLGHWEGDEWIPLKLNSIKVKLSKVFGEMKEEREDHFYVRKKTDKF
ncbi:MAG: hypothetical protein KBE55_07250 [Bacteroides sp.]|uniref:hypothetical protein n=1 Tax=Bacteroides sp. TaxID=29523 RepID=UPI001B58BCC3|nr:hypothetical protein [Bacteroides sp.]MBP9586672.1 hypothetical protein [Bacteroides sp.]